MSTIEIEMPRMWIYKTYYTSQSLMSKKEKANSGQVWGF